MAGKINPLSPDPWVFISYSRKDGEEFAADVRRRLAAEGIPLWQDRGGLEGGRDWWLQIVEALEKVAFMVLVMTPGALASPIVRKEWRYARQKGVTVYPVLDAKNPPDFSAMPRWMRDANFYDLAHDATWQKFLADLRRTPERRRVPFMVEDLPSDFVARPAEFDRLIALLVDEKREEPVAITAALRGAGGFGKTTLARALCHDERIQDAFDDGILWVTLGEQPGELIGRLADLIEALSGERPGYTTLEAAGARFAECLADRDLLLVIDDVWNATHARPFLSGGSRCARLITTRDFETLPAAAQRVEVEAMREGEAVALLSAGFTVGTQRDTFTRLAARLCEWPILLKLVNKAIHDQIALHHRPLDAALSWVNKALDRKGLTAFDPRDPGQSRGAVARTLEVSFELLQVEETARFRELAIFPEDVDVPLATVEKLWAATGGLGDFATEELAHRLAQLSLLLELDLERRTLRLHDVVRLYLLGLVVGDLQRWHAALLDAHRPATGWAALPDAEPHLWHHLAHHLVGAGRGAELVETVQDLAWLARKTWLVKSPTVEQDFAVAGSVAGDNATVSLLRRFYVQASHLLNAARTLGDVQAALHCRLAHSAEFGAAASQLGRAIAPPWLALTQPPPDLPDPGLVRTIAGQREVTSVAFSPDGHWIVSGSGDRTLKLWGAASGQLLRSFEGHQNWVAAVAFSPDGRWIVSGSADETLKLWDAASGQLLRSFEGHQGQVTSAAFSSDGRWIVSGSADETLKLWDAASGQLMRSFEGHQNWVAAVAFSPDGRWIVSGSYDKTVKLWDAASGEPLRSVEGHQGWITAAAFSPDGRWILSGSWDQTLKLWDAASGQLMRSFEGHKGFVSFAAFNADGRRIVSGSWDQSLKLWDAASGQLLLSFEGHQSAVSSGAFSPDGRWIVSGSGDQTLKLWDAASIGLPGSVEGHRNAVSSAVFSPDGRLIVSSSYDKTLKLWDTASSQLLHSFEGHLKSVTTAGFSPDGRWIVSGSFDHALKLWDAASGQLLRSFEGHQSAVSSGAFSPDGRWIVSGSFDHALKLWDAASGQLLRSFEGHQNWVTSAAFSPDGRWIVSSSYDKTLKLWDTASGQLLHSFEGHQESVATAVFSPDGCWIVSASWDQTLKLWDAASAQLLRTFEGHQSGVNTASFSPNGRWIVSGSGDRTLKLWDVASGACSCTLHVDGSLETCNFSPDGERIVAGGSAGLYFLRVIW